MKKAVVLLAILALLSPVAFGQATSPKKITEKVGRKVEKRNNETKAALSESATAPGEKPAEPPPPPPPPPPGHQPSLQTGTAAPKPLPVLRQKSKEEKDAALKKTVDFQRQRAMSGQASAQYDLGMRYLSGEGVDKNPEQARKWIEMAAKQNYEPAVKRLAELEKAKP